MSSAIPGTGITVLTDQEWSLRLYYQLLNGFVDQRIEKNGVWTNEELIVTPVDGSPLSSITWNNGKEIRVYYLDTNYIIQEWAYTEGKGWYQGAIGQSKVKATPSSGLAAIVYDGTKGSLYIRLYYQESGTNEIAALYNINSGSWKPGDLRLAGALGGTQLAAVVYRFQNQLQIRLYYQAADLYLKEHCYNDAGWFPGGFNPGQAPARTPLAAVAFGDIQLQVYWRDLTGNVVFSNNTGTWLAPTVISIIEFGYGLTVLQWENGKRLRLFYQHFTGAIVGIYSDDAGKTWNPDE